jgi:hypothetical protein
MNKACKTLSTAIIPLVCNMAQNKATNDDDDIVTILDCVEKIFQKYNMVTAMMKLVIMQNMIPKVAYQIVNKVGPVVNWWQDVKCGLFISCSHQTSLKHFVYVCLCKERTIIYTIM